MNKDRLHYLYKRYINGTGSEQELAELQAYIKNAKEDENLIDLLDATWEELEESDMKDLSADKAEMVYQQIISESQTRRDNKGWMRFAASIAIFLSFALGIYLVYNNNKLAQQNDLALNQSQEQVAPTPEAIVPGSNHAVLTLADGSC